MWIELRKLYVNSLRVVVSFINKVTYSQRTLVYKIANLRNIKKYGYTK